MSYNQKPTGPSGSSGSAPNGPNNQTSQQVAKTLAGIQQQMQNLVHSQSSLPQSTPPDLNAFFQQQRFQNMFKQQQQQLLQQHFQQQIQHQQNKDRGGGSGEPLALTRTPAAAELLNKTYQQHHQQQANGSSTNNPTLASVNQQIQQQLQAFPPNIMQQLQAFQYQIQQQQHPQQQQHLAQSPLQQVHQQSQSGQSQHQSSQQQLHGQTHQQQQKALTTAAAHMQQLQQSLQQKYLSAAAAAASQPTGGAKIVATPPPPPLTNQLKSPNLLASTQLTAVPPVSSGSSSSNTTGAAKMSLTSSSLTASSAAHPSKQVPPSISLVPSKSVTSPTLSASHQQIKVGTITNKPVPMVSSIPPPFPTHYQKSSNAAPLDVTSDVANSAPVNSTKIAVNAENTASKSYPTEVSSLSKQQMPISADCQTTKPDPSASTSIAAVTLNTNPVTVQNKAPVSIPASLVQQKTTTENGNKSVSIHAPEPPLKDLKTSKESSTTFVADSISLEVTAKPEEKSLAEVQALTPITNKSLKLLQDTDTPKNASITENVKVVSDTTEVSSAINATKENVYVKDKKEESLTIYQTSKAMQFLIAKPEVYLADDVKEDDIKEKPVIETNAEGCQNNITKCTDKPTDVDESKPTALYDPGKPNKPNQENVELIDIAITPKSRGDNIIVINAPMSSTLVENTQIKGQDIIETKNTNDDKNINVEKANKPEHSKEVLEISTEKEEIKIALTVTGESTFENKSKKSELVKVNENVCTSAETPKRKHGQQPRTSKASFLCSTSENELRKHSSCEDRLTLKQKAEDITESPPSTPIEMQKSNDRKSQRHRLKTILYQSPLPELAYITKLSASEASNSPKPMSVEDKLIVFYKNEYMAVRNAEGTFYLCQTMQNVYRTSPRISIRWLSEDKKDGSIFIPDFYDHTDIECVLTTVELKRVDKGQLRLPKAEKTRIESILKKAIDVEKGLVPRPDVTEENPDGLDISLYKDESQIEKKSSAGSTPSSSSQRYRRSGGNTHRSSSTVKTERTLKKGLTGAKNKSPNKKRKTLTKKNKAARKNSSDEDVSSDEEHDAEYKPNQKKTNTSSTTSKSPRAQRSPLAKARVASPITPTSSKTYVPQTSSSSTTANNRIVRSNKRKSTMEISIETDIKKIAPTNPAKTAILKNKVDGSSVETTTNRKSYDTTDLLISDNSPSTSADAAAASGHVCSGTRPTRNRK